MSLVCGASPPPGLPRGGSAHSALCPTALGALPFSPCVRFLPRESGEPWGDADITARKQALSPGCRHLCHYKRRRVGAACQTPYLSPREENVTTYTIFQQHVFFPLFFKQDRWIPSNFGSLLLF